MEEGPQKSNNGEHYKTKKKKEKGNVQVEEREEEEEDPQLSNEGQNGDGRRPTYIQ